MKKILIVLAIVLCISMSYAMATAGTLPSSLAKNSRAEMNIQTSGGLQPIVTEHGKISWSIDANGSNSGTGTLRVEKPAGATVRSAYLMAAGTGGQGDTITDSSITLAGASVAFTSKVLGSFSTYSYFTDVTSIVKPIIDGAGAGITDLTVTEAYPSSIDGETLVVIFNDPNQLVDNTIILAFGAQQTTGDTFSIGLSDAINKSTPGFALDMSLGISYSYQYDAIYPTSQYSRIDINDQRLTTSAGGQDDGSDMNGALITTGGIGDSNTNPPDPYATDSYPRYDDELYSLIPFVNDGDTTINAYTLNPSNDDNIYFAGFFLGSTTACVGCNILLSPVSATNFIGTDHTVTGTLRDDAGAPLVGVTVYFEITSGPNAGKSFNATTDSNGKAFFTYTGNIVGTDTIIASFYNNAQVLITSDPVTKEWIESNECSSSMTVVYGKITDSNGPVANTPFEVTCTHNNVESSESGQTLSDGTYAVVFTLAKCAPGDTITLHALDRDAHGTVTNNCTCLTNLGLINLEIPEFGIIAAVVALLGAFGIIIYRRSR